MSNIDNFWVVIPAAGVGKRMEVDHPKQYLRLEGSNSLNATVIEQTISRFSHHSKIKGIVVVISKDDEYWPTLEINHTVPLYLAEGGKERCHSVLNGLTFLKGKAQENDWILVHDAARPCLHLDDIEKLMGRLSDHSIGGLLGLPVADTLKFCSDDRQVKRTVDRSGLWRALTPQMFRYQKLLDALNEAIIYPEKITDEASAIEMAGYEPLMVEGRWDNIKITHPQDLSQANLILESH